jgi:hypothetical protein
MSKTHEIAVRNMNRTSTLAISLSLSLMCARTLCCLQLDSQECQSHRDEPSIFIFFLDLQAELILHKLAVLGELEKVALPYVLGRRHVHLLVRTNEY